MPRAARDRAATSTAKKDSEETSFTVRMSLLAAFKDLSTSLHSFEASQTADWLLGEKAIQTSRATKRTFSIRGLLRRSLAYAQQVYPIHGASLPSMMDTKSHLPPDRQQTE